MLEMIFFLFYFKRMNFLWHFLLTKNKDYISSLRKFYVTLSSGIINDNVTYTNNKYMEVIGFADVVEKKFLNAAN